MLHGLICTGHRHPAEQPGRLEHADKQGGQANRPGQSREPRHSLLEGDGPRQRQILLVVRPVSWAAGTGNILKLFLQGRCYHVFLSVSDVWVASRSAPRRVTIASSRAHARTTDEKTAMGMGTRATRHREQSGPDDTAVSRTRRKDTREWAVRGGVHRCAADCSMAPCPLSVACRT